MTFKARNESMTEMTEHRNGQQGKKTGYSTRKTSTCSRMAYLASQLWASWPESPEMPQSQGPPQSTEERMNPETAPRGLLSRLGELNLGDMGSSDRQQRWSQRKARGQVADCWHSSFIALHLRYDTTYKLKARSPSIRGHHFYQSSNSHLHLLSRVFLIKLVRWFLIAFVCLVGWLVSWVFFKKI